MCFYEFGPRFLITTSLRQHVAVVGIQLNRKRHFADFQTLRISFATAA
jgi:hypothetical protein